MKFKLYFDSLCILYIHMQIYIYIYTYTNLQVNAKVSLLHPRRGESQG